MTTARSRLRAELTAEIKRIAREQLAVDGASGLSLRAVARELGMVSSAVYRYFGSRDELLTALIIDAYDAMGEAAEAADRPGSGYIARWLDVCHAVRGWALAHPHEYALLYGSPVPGYHAPDDTVRAAVRTGRVLGRILSDASATGQLQPAGVAPAPLLADAEAMSALVMPGVPAESVLRGVAAWTQLFGAISFEVFGHYANVLTDTAAGFEYMMTNMGRAAGLPES
ncbi:TetR/AcrR family transcriptional regulator [Longispora albida]|uniref:TetR/AcrR family transcriptional regulator n=1 Tax=Longispora albida TaxID=203523 RepID=UPI00036F0AC5|nr:TetR/AcrR family transcriptional regulator [Longispora albida]